GSNSHNTVFRNWLVGTTKISKPLSGRGAERTDSTWWACQANRACNVDFAGRYYNILGNAVGSTDLLNVTSYNNGTHKIPSVRMIIAPQYRSYDATTYCYCFGYSEANDDGTSGTYPEDSKLPYTTALLHGNYDFTSDSIVWDPSIADHALPASLYLSSMPAWWCGAPWPPIGPDVSGYVNDIPAKLRFEGAPCVAAVMRTVPQVVTKSGRAVCMVYNVQGKLMASFVASGKLTAAILKRMTGANGGLPGGIYLCRMSSGSAGTSAMKVLIR
ncbi:MAG TPA: hypothetical protein VKF42_06415, partial [Chitinivibrionales bacterium]|nr:hypothetical protein [Chitinivibrionales bacterium]